MPRPEPPAQNSLSSCRDNSRNVPEVPWQVTQMAQGVRSSSGHPASSAGAERGLSCQLAGSSASPQAPSPRPRIHSTSQVKSPVPTAIITGAKPTTRILHTVLVAHGVPCGDSLPPGGASPPSARAGPQLLLSVLLLLIRGGRCNAGLGAASDPAPRCDPLGPSFRICTKGTIVTPPLGVSPGNSSSINENSSDLQVQAYSKCPISAGVQTTGLQSAPLTDSSLPGVGVPALLLPQMVKAQAPCIRGPQSSYPPTPGT
ncbi:hypothetical protein AAY473_010036 [Plecturocebus cupreus]